MNKGLLEGSGSLYLFVSELKRKRGFPNPTVRGYFVPST